MTDTKKPESPELPAQASLLDINLSYFRSRFPAAYGDKEDVAAKKKLDAEAEARKKADEKARKEGSEALAAELHRRALAVAQGEQPAETVADTPVDDTAGKTPDEIAAIELAKRLAAGGAAQ